MAFVTALPPQDRWLYLQMWAGVIGHFRRAYQIPGFTQTMRELGSLFCSQDRLSKLACNMAMSTPPVVSSLLMKLDGDKIRFKVGEILPPDFAEGLRAKAILLTRKMDGSVSSSVPSPFKAFNRDGIEAYAVSLAQGVPALVRDLASLHNLSLRLFKKPTLEGRAQFERDVQAAEQRVKDFENYHILLSTHSVRLINFRTKDFDEPIRMLRELMLFFCQMSRRKLAKQVYEKAGILLFRVANLSQIQIELDSAFI